MSVANDISRRLDWVPVYEWFTFRGQHTDNQTGSRGMPFKEPFMLGPFSVDAEGRLSVARSDVSPGFSVKWRGRVVHARLAQNSAQDGHLYVQSSLGRIPSTASDPETRAKCFTMLRNLLAALPETWRVRFLPDHQPQLEVETMVSLPITVTNLVTELASFLLVLSPYLERLDEMGVTVVASNHGTGRPLS